MMKSVTLMGSMALLAPVNVAAAPDAVPTISATGDGAWEMICHVVAGGDQLVRVLSADRHVYADPKMQRASCEYRNSQRGPLTISISGANTCPFKGASAEACTISVPSGRAGSFELRVNRAG